MKRIPLVAIAALAAAGSSAQAQTVLSARSGMVHYTEGEVFIADKRIDPKPAEFPRVEEGQTLRTAEGRVEVLLTPGVFLRLAENSEVRMISSSLSDTRMELLSGSALVEAGELSKEHSIALTLAGTVVEFRKHGLFRIDTNPARVRAYDGEAMIVKDSQSVTLKESRETLLTGVLAAEKFNKETSPDAFHRWASRRAGYLAAANISAARRISDSGLTLGRSGWIYNSFFGMFTYVPGLQNYWSPFGYSYYAPNHVADVYYRPQPLPSGVGMSPDMGVGGGIRNSSPNYGGYRGGGYSGGGGGYSAAPPPAPTGGGAPPPSGPRGGDGGGSRGSSSGR